MPRAPDQHPSTSILALQPFDPLVQLLHMHHHREQQCNSNEQCILLQLHDVLLVAKVLDWGAPMLLSAGLQYLGYSETSGKF